MGIKVFVKRNKIGIYLLISILLTLTVLFIIYALLQQKVEVADTFYADRGIDTLPKLWLKGYLGIFFNFLEISNVLWLLIPFGVLYFIKKKNIVRWQAAIITVIIFSLALIGYQGYYNSRYALTLVPFLCGITLIVLAELTKGFSWRYKAIIVFILVSLILVNISKNDLMRQGWIFNNGAYSIQWPWKLFNFCDNLPAKTHFVVFNYPEFYYYTKNHALTYMDGVGLIVDNTALPLFESWGTFSDQQKIEILKKKYHIEYLLIPGRPKYELIKYQKFLNTYCVTINSEKEVVLYKIK